MHKKHFFKDCAVRQVKLLEVRALCSLQTHSGQSRSW